jgi:hypothetical protein
MVFVGCPLCGGPLFAQQFDWSKRVGLVSLVTSHDMTYSCRRGCGWGVSIPCSEGGAILE